MSVPTVPNKIPKSVIPTALMIEPEASTIAPIRPRIISEKYSAAPNFNAKAVKGRAKAANIKVPMVPDPNNSAGFWFPVLLVSETIEATGVVNELVGVFAAATLGWLKFQ